LPHRRSLGAGAMAQPSSKIAEAFCGREQGREGDAKLWGDSVSSKRSLDPLTCADTEASAQSLQCGTEELAAVLRALAALREAVTAPEGCAQSDRAPMAINASTRHSQPLLRDLQRLLPIRPEFPA
jgi:hypothetical protein